MNSGAVAIIVASKMASVRKKMGSPYWFACLRLPDGRRSQVSTKLLDRKKAQNAADLMEAASRSVQTKTQFRKVLARIYELAAGEPVELATVRNYACRWLEQRRQEVAPSTHTKYTTILREFVEVLGPTADQDIASLTPDEVRRFRDEMAEQASPSTANGKLKVIRVVLTGAWKEGLTSENVASKVPTVRLRAQGGRRRPFKPDELTKLLAIAPRDWQGMIGFGLYTGQRLADIAKLKWASIDTVERSVSLVSSKTGRRTLVPLVGPLITFLGTEPRSDSAVYVFPRAADLVLGDGRVARLSEEFHLLMVQCQLATPRTHKRTGNGRSAARKPSELSFHSLRHTTTSWLKSAQVPTAVVMDIVGHDSAAISQNYTHFDLTIKESALNTLPDVLSSLSLNLAPVLDGTPAPT